ncbi:myosin-2 heavy chain isoform X2 [Ricinus communis]|uniref:myosin-2 heavy chain isoform X2 n=1 Tax=Ricinus communis TaxID=3988 RepID=UPI00201B0E29|nr:myosin-2 heavy chain isoform X2 [Ricinus communis]
MAADVPVKQLSLPVNPCCALWKEKCSKLEGGRKHLRQAVQILNEQVDKIQAENLALKKAYEEEKARAGTEKVEREQELAARVAFEKEISALKSELCSLKQKGIADVEDKTGELKILQDHVSKADKEIARLKALLEKEKKRADSEKKNAEAQKKSASEAWKLMKAEKAKAEEERKLANSEGKNAEEYRLQLEGLRNEVEEAKSKLVSETLKYEEASKMVEAEKNKVTEERKRADSEMDKAEQQRKLAEANEKKFMDEKSLANSLSQQLEDARQEVEELQKEINNLTSSKNLGDASRNQYDQINIPPVNSEMSSLQQKSSSDIEDKTRELKLFQDCVSEGEKQINRLKVLLEKEKEEADYVKKNAEAEKKRAAEAWEHVKAEKAKADEEKKHADIERKKADGYRIQLEALRKEANETKAKFMSEISQLEKAIKELEREKHQKFEEATKRIGGKKKKAMTERKHTDIELMEAEEQRKLVEVNRKMALEEKSRADKLSCQLEESRHKTKELQKQIKEFWSSRKAVEAPTTSPSKDVNAETRNLKLLEKQLKLEKMRLKYAKQVSKLEKNRNINLQNELSLIKMDSVQISRRLGALDKWFSSGLECREDLENAAHMRRPKLKRKLCDLEPFPMYAETESELLKSSRMTSAASNPVRKTLYCNAPLFPVSGGYCTASISGIDSKLKSLDGGSSQKLLQSSAMNSSSASFSDGQLVGSQERGAFVPTSSEKKVEENDGKTTSCMFGEVTKTQCNENVAVVAENSIRSPNSADTSGGVNGRARKFNRVFNAIESVEVLYSEGRKLHLQMEEKLSVLHGMLNREIDKPVEASLQDGSYAKHEGGRKKRKVSCDERIILQHLCSRDEQERTIKIRSNVQNDGNAYGPASSSAMDLLGVPQECIKGLSDSFGFDLEKSERFEEIENGDYMKLLDLDNTADEECYRRAMEMPLSPTLPEIEISRIETFDVDNFRAFNFNGGLSNEKEVLVPSHRLDVAGVEVSSNNLRCIVSGTPCNEILRENKGLVDSVDMLGNEKGYCNTVGIKGTSDRQTRDSEVVEMLNMPSSSLNSSDISSESKLGLPHGNIPAYCVVFSNINDPRSVSRIFCAIRTCMARCSLDTERECLVQKIFHALKTEAKISPKEKACALFTLLLLNFSWCTLDKCGNFADKNFFLCLDSFACRINAVVCAVEARSLFAELCCCEELVGLIEDFLINGRLMVHSDASIERLEGCDSRINIFLDGIYLNFSSNPASADQLVAGSIILASVCAAIDHIEFICEASYNLLQIRKYENDTILIILHVFAYLGGKKFLSLEEYSLTMTVLRSIVVFLEGDNSLVSSASSLSPSHAVRSKFHPCAKCPFGAVSVDVVISLLLEKLHGCALSVTTHQHMMESANLSNSHVLCTKEYAQQSSSHEQIFGALDMNCGASYDKSSTHSNSVGIGSLFDLSDVLSLVELIACYMSWEWTCGRIIPVLLEILERPMVDDFAVAVVLLLGQLGRTLLADHLFLYKLPLLLLYWGFCVLILRMLSRVI